MKIRVDAWAWIPKDSLTFTQMQALRAALTVIPRKVGDYPGEKPGPIHLFVDTPTHIGIAREYYRLFKQPQHETDLQVSDGLKELASPIGEFTFTLRPAQAEAVGKIVEAYKSDETGGMLQAAPGTGKTIMACAVAAALQVPTLVIVHKEFLVDQWKLRIEQCLPEAKVGIVQQDKCEFLGRSIAIGMIHSLVERDYAEEFFDWPGLIIMDECHRVGAATWSNVPPRFRARFRLGLSATPRRKDGAENVFKYHLGRILYQNSEPRLKVKVRKIPTKFKLVRTDNFNPSLVKKPLLLSLMCGSVGRNRQIVEQLILAVNAGRKVLVLSERLNHLETLEQLLFSSWPNSLPKPTTGSYVGGMSKSALAESAEAQVIFATSQFVQEGLDIPELDTLFMTTPMSDVEQAVGRIQRPAEGKKEPVVVDFIDEGIPVCVKWYEYREDHYKKVA